MELNSIFFHLNRTLRILLEYRPKMVLSREALTSMKPLQLNKQVKIEDTIKKLLISLSN